MNVVCVTKARLPELLNAVKCSLMINTSSLGTAKLRGLILVSRLSSKSWLGFAALGSKPISILARSLTTRHNFFDYRLPCEISPTLPLNLLP
jgi:hypothetical protein